MSISEFFEFLVESLSGSRPVGSMTMDPGDLRELLRDIRELGVIAGGDTDGFAPPPPSGDPDSAGRFAGVELYAWEGAA